MRCSSRSDLPLQSEEKCACMRLLAARIHICGQDELSQSLKAQLKEKSEKEELYRLRTHLFRRLLIVDLC